MAGSEGEDTIEMEPLNPAVMETGSYDKREARTDPATAGAEIEEGGGGGAGDRVRCLQTLSGIILNMLILGETLKSIILKSLISVKRCPYF